jgi:hypothetical protein
VGKSCDPTEVGENSCRVHVGVLPYIILFIVLLSFGVPVAEPGPLTLRQNTLAEAESGS